MTATELFTTVTEDDTPKDFRRDQWGRPSIMQPDGRRKGYTRCSSAAKTIEDRFNIEESAYRKVAYGVAIDSSLTARILAVGGDPWSWDKADKKTMTEIVRAAETAAKTHRNADIGTAIHHMTHRLDRGEEVVGGPYQADLDAYRGAIAAAGLSVHIPYIECRMVNDDLEMAGTADRILYEPGLRQWVIADIKTGATIDFGGLGWAAQLAAYAGGLLYDTEREVRLETPEMDQDVGLIIHLPAGEGVCTIYEVDIASGYKAAVLANEIRAVRKASKTWITPVTQVQEQKCTTNTTSPKLQHQTSPSSKPGTTLPTTTLPRPGPSSNSALASEPNAAEISRMPSNKTSNDLATTPPPDRRAELRRRYNLLNDHNRAKFRGLMLDPDDLDLIETHLDGLDAFMNVHAEAPPPKPAMTPSDVPAQRPKVVPIPEPSLGHDVEGDLVPDAEWTATARAFDALDATAKAWIKNIVFQAHEAQQWMSGAGGNRTTRRHQLLCGLVTLASSGNDEDGFVRLVVSTVLGFDNSMRDGWTLGQVVGSLNVTHATKFAELCQAFCAGELQASVREDGTMRLIPAA